MGDLRKLATKRGWGAGPASAARRAVARGATARPPVAVGTYLDPLLCLGEGRLRRWFRLQGLKSFQTESGASHLRSPASTEALGRRDEHSRLRRSALSAPSRPPRSPAAFPAPTVQVPEDSGAHCRRTLWPPQPLSPGLPLRPLPQLKITCQERRASLPAHAKTVGGIRPATRHVPPQAGFLRRADRTAPG